MKFADCKFTNDYENLSDSANFLQCFPHHKISIQSDLLRTIRCTAKTGFVGYTSKEIKCVTPYMVELGNVLL